MGCTQYRNYICLFIFLFGLATMHVDVKAKVDRSKPPELSKEVVTILKQAVELRKKGVLLTKLADVNHKFDIDFGSSNSDRIIELSDMRWRIAKQAVTLCYVSDSNEAYTITQKNADTCFRKAMGLIEQAENLAPTHPRPVWERALTTCERGPSAGGIVMITDGINDQLVGQKLSYSPSILQDCDRAKRLDPNDPDTLHACAKIFSKHYEVSLHNARITANMLSLKTVPGNEFKRLAMDHINRAIMLADDNGEFYLTRAKFHVKNEQELSAIADLDLAVKYAPDLSEAYYIRGSLRMKQKDYSNAWEDISKAKELGYDVPEAMYDDALMKYVEVLKKRQKELLQ